MSEIKASDVPKLLSGAIVYIAPHRGGKRGMPADMNKWLKALGAKTTATFTLKTTHVLIQHSSYEPTYGFEEAIDVLSKLSIRMERGNRLDDSPINPRPGSVLVNESNVFMRQVVRLVSDGVKRDKSAFNRSKQFLDISASTTNALSSIVGF